MGEFKLDKELFKKLLAEFTGTAVVLTLGCTLSQHTHSGIEYALGWGLSYMLAMHVFMFLSGAHLNPAVSGCATILGVMDWKLMLCYMLAQLLGALMGFLLAWLGQYSIDWSAAGYQEQPSQAMKDLFLQYLCVHNYERHSDDLPFNLGMITELKIMLIEFVFMCVLLLAYCAMWDTRSMGIYDSISIRIGLIFASLCYVLIPWTGCSLNFFRTLAPSLAYLSFGYVWPFFVGHLLAVIVVGVLWRFVIAEGEAKAEE